METRLREWRHKRGETLHTLADKAGVHRITIVRIEQGRMSPTLAMMEKLAKALDISVRELIPVERRGSRRQKGRA